MNRIMFFLAALMFITTSLSVLLATGEGQQASASATSTSEQKEQYEKSIEERLRKLEKQLDELKSRVAVVTVQMKRNLEADINAAEKKQRIAFQKFEEIRKESEKKWKKFSTDMNKAVSDFEKAYEKAKSHFKE